MCIQAKVTLTTLNDNIFPVKRIITLDQDSPRITVGRASKSQSKALHSAGDNAWFDSPVMSRYHAEINLDTVNETLILRDVGSMHGTFVNTSQIASQVPTKIHDGDELVFGSEVKRGCETYPPCKFLINYDISPCKAANTFSFPESSDFDDDEDISFSGSIMVQDQTELMPNETKIYPEASLKDEPQRENPAVLIRNNSPVTKKEKVGSLVSQDLHLPYEKPTKTRGDDALLSGKLDLATDIEEFDSSSKDEEEPTHDLDSHNSGNARTSIWTNEIKAIMNSKNDNGDQKHLGSFISELEGQTKDRHHFEKTENFNSTNKEIQKAHSSEDKSDIPSNEGHSNVSGENIKNSIETEIPSKNRCISLVPYNYEYIRDRSAQPSDWYSPLQLAAAVIKKRVMHSCTEGNFNPSNSSNENLISEHEVRDSILADPSSSMTTLLDQDQNTSFEVRNANSTEELWSQVLGEKLGKTAYFRAREFNKAKFHSMSPFFDDIHSSHESNLRQIPRQASLTFNHAKVRSEDNPLHKPYTYDRKSVNQKEISTLSRYVLNDVMDLKNSIPGQGPDQVLDKSNTSISKINLGNETISSSEFRNGINIHNSIQTDIGALPNKNNGKRKAEAISENLNKDFCPWANSSLTLNSESSTNLLEDLQEEGDLSTTHTSSCPRPSKRRRVVEGLGYAALGGFATAVGLFSILVATAPDFS